MILGVGIDIVSVKRIKNSIERYGERFIRRVFTKKEQEYCSGKAYPFDSYAGRFAVKEAAFKALGRGWYDCGGFTSVEVTTDKNGLPQPVFHGKAREFAISIHVKKIFVSITHDANVSVAVVILEG
ncbi:MAG TPA: holo-ACP synthase [Anaerolineae bacterium]|nr:holo-ACP synthase [Anaerolineae bacterium]